MPPRGGRVYSNREVRSGKYHALFVRASGLVQLDPDVRDAIPDDVSVNSALRRVIELANSLQDKP